MHAKPDLRVFLKWVIARFGSVITDVIPPGIQRDDMIDMLKIPSNALATCSDQVRP